MKSKAVIIDIDGVICDSTIRSEKYIDYDAYNAGDADLFINSLHKYSKTTAGDIVIPEGKKLFLSILKEFRPDVIIYLTARGEYGRKPTERWLRLHGFFKCPRTILHMRPENDMVNGKNIDLSERLKDYEYKHIVAKSIIKNYDVVLAVDDKIEICNVYKKLGIPVLHKEFVAIPSGV